MTKKTIILKEEAVALFRTKAALARALGISKVAVSQWTDDQPIPQLQALRIRYELRPECFIKTKQPS
jgi:ribosomal protein S12 methylthiotransferase accessory factor YcaO